MGSGRQRETSRDTVWRGHVSRCHDTTRHCYRARARASCVKKGNLVLMLNETGLWNTSIGSCLNPGRLNEKTSLQPHIITRSTTHSTFNCSLDRKSGQPVTREKTMRNHGNNKLVCGYLTWIKGTSHVIRSIDIGYQVYTCSYTGFSDLVNWIFPPGREVEQDMRRVRLPVVVWR